MRFRVIGMVLTIGLLALAAIGQTTEKKNAAPPSKFDADLAKKVGADKYGMRSYVLAILKTGPKDAEIQGDARKSSLQRAF